MARVIQEHIKRPLAEELLFGSLAQGGRVAVTVEEGKLAISARSGRELVPVGSS
jgi:ATP-dependent Clp protease ATP-binding subunit ClpA